jgi:hypothetical protein
LCRDGVSILAAFSSEWLQLSMDGRSTLIDRLWPRLFVSYYCLQVLEVRAALMSHCQNAFIQWGIYNLRGLHWASFGAESEQSTPPRYNLARHLRFRLSDLVEASVVAALLTDGASFHVDSCAHGLCGCKFVYHLKRPGSRWLGFLESTADSSGVSVTQET